MLSTSNRVELLTKTKRSVVRNYKSEIGLMENLKKLIDDFEKKYQQIINDLNALISQREELEKGTVFISGEILDEDKLSNKKLLKIQERIREKRAKLSELSGETRERMEQTKALLKMKEELFKKEARVSSGNKTIFVKWINTMKDTYCEIFSI